MISHITVQVRKIRQLLSRSYWSVRLLNLSKYVQDLLNNNKLEMGHARALLTLPFDEQEIVARKIVDKNLTVRDAERMVQVYKFSKGEKNHHHPEKVDGWLKKLSTVFSSKVLVVINEKGEGRLVMHFKSPEEVDRIVDLLVE